MQKDLTEIKVTLAELPKELIKELDKRYARKEKVEEIEETVAPLTKLRKRLWSFYLATALSMAVLLTIIYENVKEHIK